VTEVGKKRHSHHNIIGGEKGRKRGGLELQVSEENMCNSIET